jgi:deoxyribodipyrimidine photolyase
MACIAFHIPPLPIGLPRPRACRSRWKVTIMGQSPQPAVPLVAGGVEQTRVRLLNKHQLPKSAPENPDAPPPFVLYWMQNSVRARHSPALEHAAGIATSLNVPLRAVHTFDSVAPDGRPLPERHAAFLLESLANAQTTLRTTRNISLAVVAPGAPPETAIPALAVAALAVITDTSYLRRGIADRLRVAATLNIPFIAVEGDIVVPVQTASNKVEYAARTIRPKLSRLIPDYLSPLAAVPLPTSTNPHLDPSTRSPDSTSAWIAGAGLTTLDVRDVSAALASIPGLDRAAPRVPACIFTGGETHAQKTLATFLNSRLSGYAKDRNEPALDLQSDLSLYLRVGAISPVDVAVQTHAHAAALKFPSKAVSDSVSSFLEELIVRRELAINSWFSTCLFPFSSVMQTAVCFNSLTFVSLVSCPKCAGSIEMVTTSGTALSRTTLETLSPFMRTIQGLKPTRTSNSRLPLRTTHTGMLPSAKC